MSNVAVELQWWQRWDGTSVECIDDEPECFSHYQQSCYTVSNKLSMYCTSTTHGMLRHMSDEMKKLQSLCLYNFALRWIINRGYTYLYSFFWVLVCTEQGACTEVRLISKCFAMQWLLKWYKSRLTFKILFMVKYVQGIRICMNQSHRWYVDRGWGHIWLTIWPLIFDKNTRIAEVTGTEDA